MENDLAQAVQGLVVSQAKMQEQITTLFKQQTEIKELTKTVQSLAMSIEKQAMSLRSTEDKLDTVRTDVDEMKAKPAKKWDSVQSILLSVVLTAVATYLLTRLGL
jgi:septal ring factor EnvC (AmiA/AmiB activator)